MAPSADESPKSVCVKVEFTYAQTISTSMQFELTSDSGGLETVFQNKRFHSFDLPPNSETNDPPTVGHLVDHIVLTHLSDSPKKELFVLNGAVRPGLLVLINDADWELEGEAAYELKSGDEIVFVSTLHGG